MKKHATLFFVSVLFTLILIPLSLTCAEEVTHQLQLAQGYEKVSKVLELKEGQEFLFSFDNQEASSDSISYTVTKVDGDKILAHGHLQPGEGKEIKGLYLPGMYRVTIKCSKQNSIGNGSITIKDKDENIQYSYDKTTTTTLRQRTPHVSQL